MYKGIHTRMHTWAKRLVSTTEQHGYQHRERSIENPQTLWRPVFRLNRACTPAGATTTCRRHALVAVQSPSQSDQTDWVRTNERTPTISQSQSPQASTTMIALLYDRYTYLGNESTAQKSTHTKRTYMLPCQPRQRAACRRLASLFGTTHQCTQDKRHKTQNNTSTLIITVLFTTTASPPNDITRSFHWEGG